MYGAFGSALRDAVRPFILDQHVYDVGGGDGERAQALLELGAKSITVIDKERTTLAPVSSDMRCWRIEKPLDEYVLGLPDFPNFTWQVMHLAWPPNYAIRDLLRCVKQSRHVIYVGCNTDGTVCGTPELFEYLRHRPVKAYVPTRKNTLIVYGPGEWRRDCLYHEEYLGLYQNEAWAEYSATDRTRSDSGWARLLRTKPHQR